MNGFGYVPSRYRFEKEEQAVMAVRNNEYDIWEMCFDYAIIEEIPEGMYSLKSKRRTWWKYNRGGYYEKIDEPDFANNSVNAL